MKTRRNLGRNVTCSIPVPAGSGPTPDPASEHHEIVVRIAPADPNAAPVKRPPSSREIARRKAKAEAVVRAAAAAQALARQVQPGLKPPAGRLFATDAAGLLLRGPLGGIGSSTRIVRTLEPLAAGGRHPAAVLVAAGGWTDEPSLREALAGLAPKLAAIGLRICRRKAGVRMAKLKPVTSSTSGA